MSAALALGRLFLRPYVLLNAFTTYGLAAAVGFLAFALRGGKYGLASATAAEIAWRAELVLALGSVIPPLAFGTWAAWSVYELLACPFAAGLPGLRRRLVG